jgi:hypothetical protein
MTDEERKLHETLQPVYEKAMGPIRGRDDVFVLDRKDTQVMSYSEFKAEEGLMYYKFLRIPLPIDSNGPGGKPSERCLWGMIDWDKYSDKFISPDGSFLIMKRRGEELHYIVDTPTLALLKALAAQSEVTV